jgi:hypothetical protein
VQRLLQFLETSPFPTLDVRQHQTLKEALAWIKKGLAPPWPLADWLGCPEREAWERITRLVSSGQL